MKGKNSTTCDPWTARDFMDGMQTHSPQCYHCLSGLMLKSHSCKCDVFLDALASLKTMFKIHLVTNVFKIIGFQEYYRVLQSITEHCRVLQGTAKYQRVLQSVAEYCRVLQSIFSAST